MWIVGAKLTKKAHVPVYDKSHKTIRGCLKSGKNFLFSAKAMFALVSKSHRVRSKSKKICLYFIAEFLAQN